MTAVPVLALILVAVVTLATVSATPRHYQYDVAVNANHASAKEASEADTASESAIELLVETVVRADVTIPVKEIIPPAEHVYTPAGDASGQNKYAEAVVPAVVSPVTHQEATAMPPIQEAVSQLKNASKDIKGAQNVVPTPRSFRRRLAMPGGSTSGWWAPSATSPWRPPSTASPWRPPSTASPWWPRPTSGPSWSDGDSTGGSSYSWDLSGFSGASPTMMIIILGVLLLIFGIVICLRWLGC